MPQYSLRKVKHLKRNWIVASSALVVVITLWLWPSAAHSVNMLPTAPIPVALHGPYSTNFARAENPLSEGGKWLNGQRDGLDWADVRTTPGFVFGTEIGGNRPEPQEYDDSTALLKGSWGPNQTVQATVHSVNQDQHDKVAEEVELRLRSSMSPHNCTGYEVMFRCSKIPQAYCNIARWEGALGKFSYVKKSEGSKYGVSNGDVVKATMIGNVLTIYINGVQMVQVTDNTFTSGNPGLGFFIWGATGVNGDFGFSSFMATDK
ncbi:MAG: hypothetical protein ACLQVL_35065 [Terriglobia bacterium]